MILKRKKNTNINLIRSYLDVIIVEVIFPWDQWQSIAPVNQVWQLNLVLSNQKKFTLKKPKQAQDCNSRVRLEMTNKRFPPPKAARYVLIQYQYNIDTISIQYRYDTTTQYYTLNTKKCPKIPKNTQKYSKYPRYPKIPENTLPKVSKVS